MFRKWGSVVAATALIASSSMAFAGTDTQTQNKSALAPGKAAGVQKAEVLGTSTTMLLVGGAVVVGGLALALSNNGNGHASTIATGTTQSNP